jgi:WXG100 family type VII secretion target
MVEAAAKFERVNDSLQSMLKGLMSQLEGMQSAWVGAGGKSFDVVKQQWANDQAAISSALAETAGSIRESGRGYDATDSEASSRMAASNRGLQLPL